MIDHWTFGGGTAMMLQIDHRQSRDVDIFLHDPQLLPFLDPQKHDFEFEIMPAAYEDDGAGFLKLAFKDIGEIDFIVGGSLTSEPTIPRTIEGEDVKLETIPEIITKKIHHRGLSIKPRDIFDIAAAGDKCAEAIIAELKPYKGEVTNALSAIERLNPEFVNQAIAGLVIKAPYEAIARTAIDRSKEILKSV
ncbi:MAG: nucleotidyl transferase AbiEii/AbiGii toxin family protein [Pseudolabrys sp.]|nr:nucleotidyl transferase AbiEii/AbiGii toxin family protein [Pseudolabrys sp.]